MKYCFINESIGEYEDIDKSLKHWWGAFGLWWKRCQANFTFFKSCKELPKESLMIQNILKGLNVQVYAYPDADRNAFVIPGYYVGCDNNYEDLMEQYMDKYPTHSSFGMGGDFMSILLSSQLKQLLLMRKFNITNDPKRKGKKIAIFKNVKTPISVFVTYGLIQHATPQERIGIYLHEIGHWVDCAKNIPEFIIKHPDKESCYLYWNNIVKRFCTRYEELEADRFAKILGYGPELIKGLDSLLSKRKQISWIYKISDLMIKSNVQIHNDMEKRGETSVMNYPSIETRKKYLKEKE